MYIKINRMPIISLLFLAIILYGCSPKSIKDTISVPVGKEIIVEKKLFNDKDFGTILEVEHKITSEPHNASFAISSFNYFYPYLSIEIKISVDESVKPGTVSDGELEVLVKYEDDEGQHNDTFASEDITVVGVRELIKINSPNINTFAEAGRSMSISWQDKGYGKVKIDLYHQDEFIKNIVSPIYGDGHYRWIVPRNTKESDYYKIKITSLDRNHVSGESEFFGIAQFSSYSTISSSRDNAPHAELLSPESLSASAKGRSVKLTWESYKWKDECSGFKIYRNGKLIRWLKRPSSISLTDYPPHGIYDYHIAAYNSKTESEPSNRASVIIQER